MKTGIILLILVISIYFGMTEVNGSDEVGGKKNTVADELKKKGVPDEKKVSIKADTLDGKTIDVGKLSYEKPILLNFWAVWCPYCVTELPHLDEFDKKYGDRISVVGIAISYRESKSAVKRFVSSRGLGYTIGYDTGARLSNRYNVTGVPTFFLLKNGQASVLDGIPDEKSLNALLEK